MIGTSLLEMARGVDPVPAGIMSCTHENFTGLSVWRGLLCPFAETSGLALLVLFLGLCIFAGVAIYQRQVVPAAVLAILLIGLASNYIPVLAGKVGILLIIGAATGAVFLLYQVIA